MSPPPSASRVPEWLATGAAVAWRLLLLAALLWLGAMVLSRLFLVLLPVIGALILTSLLTPVASRLQRLGLPGGGAAAIALVAGVTLLAGVITFIVLRVIAQMPQLTDQLSQTRDAVMQWLQRGPLHLSPQQVQGAVDQALSQARGHAGQLVSGALGGTVLILEWVSTGLLTIVLTFFFIRDGETLVDWVLDRTVPARHRAMVRGTVTSAYHTLGSYMRGVMIVAAVDAIGTGIGLFALGLPLVIPLMTIIFLGAFIPVIGAFASGLLAVIVGLISGGPITGLFVLGIILVVQQIEGHVLQPMVMGRAVSLHPVVILLALTTGGLIGGIPGAFLAVPATASLSAGAHYARTHRDAALVGIDR